MPSTSEHLEVGWLPAGSRMVAVTSVWFTAFPTPRFSEPAVCAGTLSTSFPRYWLACADLNEQFPFSGIHWY